MGRAGGFSGGGRSGGGFSGGSRPGGGSSRGSRPGGGGSFGGGGNRGPGGAGDPGRGPGGPGMGPRPGGPRPPRRGFRGFWPWYGGGYGYGGGGCSGSILSIVIILVVAVFFIIRLVAGSVVSFSTGVTSAINKLLGNETTYESESSDNNNDYDNDNSVVSSSNNREKADTGVEFSSDCILDEIGWVEDAEATGAALEDFYNATGVQPYIYFKAYDESVTEYDDQEQYAFDWYEDNIDNEGTFLFVYFADEDTDNVVGQMFYVCGYDIDEVMDEEAVDIFWEYLNEYWYSDLSTDDMLIQTFNSTAEAIMP